MRVVVAEDQLLTREGIVRILRDAGVEVVGQAIDAESLFAIIRTENPDIALIDIRLPPTHTDEGLRAATRIRSEMPGCGVLILSQHLDLDFVRPLLEQGAQHHRCDEHQARPEMVHRTIQRELQKVNFSMAA